MLLPLLAVALLTRGPVLVGVNSTSAYVSWQTDLEQENATVRFGFSAGNYSQTAIDTGDSVNHHVQLTGLNAATTYHYAIDSDASQTDSSFTTAPAAGAKFKFILYGDDRTDSADHQSVVTAIVAEPGISFAINTGDMAQNYPFSQEWDQFFQIEHDLLRNTPLFPTVGNHETLDLLQTWGVFFSPPRFDPTTLVRYYSADWGQVHLAVLDTFDQTGPTIDSNTDTISDAQLQWLRTDLDAAKARGQLLFVSLHHGARSHATGADAHGGSPLILSQVVPELQSRGVVAMFAGHDHIYERGCVGGVDYFVAGGGGAPLYPVDAGTDPTVYAARSTLEYSVITVDGASVTGITKTPSGESIDSFSLPTVACHPAVIEAPDGGTTTTTPIRESCGTSGLVTLL
jgi:hypothetical protein